MSEMHELWTVVLLKSYTSPDNKQYKKWQHYKDEYREYYDYIQE